MVFRLGSISGEKGTRFGLAKTINSWEDYSSRTKMFLVKIRLKHLFPTALIENFSPFR